MAGGDKFPVIYVDGDVPQLPIQLGQLLVDQSLVSPGNTNLQQCTSQDPLVYEDVSGGGGGGGTVTQVDTGTGLTGGPITTTGTVELDAASIASLALADTAVQPSRTLTAGNGLTGGGDLSANRTFDVGAGTGITVNANDVAVSASILNADLVTFNDESATFPDSRVLTAGANIALSTAVAGQLGIAASGVSLIADIQTFLVGGSTSWSRPAAGKITDVYVVAGGGGGGSGRLGNASSNRGGGGGGAGGGRSFARFLTQDLDSSVTLQVGAGGTGGASRVAVNNGLNGGDGTDSFFGTGPNLVRAKGGTGGGGGTTSGGNGASNGSDGFGTMNTGGSNATTASRGKNGGNGGLSAAGSAGSSETTSEPTQQCGGGGGGGGVPTGNSPSNGGAGSSFAFYGLTGVGGGTTPGGGGSPGLTWGGSLGTGGGGSGGAANATAGASAGTGGEGGSPGGGGGGGGAATDNAGVGASGAGGDGGDGIVMVITYF